ncbi:hypothetical protein [Streptomyces sp. NPDC001652]|uniref:hypothetical protein n=1 Tax=Streptomyces sp. NPDC001652 TaxID=3154393 RepID=UPI00331A01BB
MNIGYGEAAAERLAQGTPLREAVDTGDPAAWIALDDGVRTGPWGRPAWEDTDGGRALGEALRRGAPLTEAQLALALCHRDGRIRQAVLWRTVGYPELWPLLVVRCSDWARPVREAARRRLTQVLDAEGVVRVMPLVLRIGQRQRGDFVTELATGLLRAAPRETLAPLYADPRRGVRRYAFRLAVDEGFLSPAELARTAAWDTDTVVQSLCAEAALAAVSDQDGAYDDVVEPLLAARGPRARAAGVTALRRAGRTERAVEFLADRSGVVRACARYVVRQGGIDPLAWYRERCGRPEGLPPGAVIGLAECGERVDGEVLWSLVGHPSAGVRARAVAGLRVLDVVDVRRLRALLDDPAPGVVREVTLALLPSVGRLDAAWLTERLAVERARSVRVSAFRLLQACGGLVRLRSAVAVLDDPDGHLRLWARQSVQRWYPTADVPRGAPEVGELLERARPLFGDHVLRRLLWEAGVKA